MLTGAHVVPHTTARGLPSGFNDRRLSTSSHERHLGGNDREEKDIGVQGEARHVNHRARHVDDVDGWFGCDLAAGLEHAFLHPCGHLGAGVADVDLPASDVVLSSVQSRGFREPGDRVLRRRVRCGIWPG